MLMGNRIVRGPLRIEGGYNQETASYNKEWIGRELLAWVESELRVSGRSTAQMYSDCYAYDWMLFNDLICQDGKAINLPSCINYIPIDLSTYLWAAGFDPDINREEFAGPVSTQSLFAGKSFTDGIPRKHNSLWDAAVIQACFGRLQRHVIPNTNSTVLSRHNFM